MIKCKDCRYWFHYIREMRYSYLEKIGCHKNMKLQLFGFVPCYWYEKWIPQYRISKKLKRKKIINKRDGRK